MTTEPGILLMELASLVADKDMMYPPDPGEKSATIGGNVMTNAGGMRAVKFGVTRDYVRGLEVVLPNGDIIEVGGKIAKIRVDDSVSSFEDYLGIFVKM